MGYPLLPFRLAPSIFGEKQAVLMISSGYSSADESGHTHGQRSRGLRIRMAAVFWLAQACVVSLGLSYSPPKSFWKVMCWKTSRGTPSRRFRRRGGLATTRRRRSIGSNPRTPMSHSTEKLPKRLRIRSTKVQI